MSDLPPAGWYPDPENQEKTKYWDGAKWTDTPPPPPPPSGAPPPPPPTAGPGTPEKKKAGKGKVILIVVGVLLLLAIIGGLCSDPDAAKRGFEEGFDRGRVATDTASPAGEESPAPAARQEAMLQKFEGSTDQTTRPFDAPDRWEVRWNFTGQGHNSLSLFAANGQQLELFHNDIGPGQSSAFVPKGGSFYFEINASGPFTIEVWQLA